MSLRYAVAVFVVGCLGAALIVASGGRLGEAGVRGALLGAVLACLGAVGGMALLAGSFERGPRKLFGALVGGILARLLIFGAVLVYVGLRAAASFDLIATAAALLGFTVIFEWLEVRFVLRGLRGKAS